MTEENQPQQEKGLLEKMLEGFSIDISKMGELARGIYSTVGSILKRTDDVYDLIAHQKDVPLYDPDDDPYGLHSVG